MDDSMSFYALYVEGKNFPSKFHSDVEEARNEASRLAKKEPGKRVFILQPVEYAVSEAPVTFHSTKEA